jgi:hypothetical protein
MSSVCVCVLCKMSWPKCGPGNCRYEEGVGVKGHVVRKPEHIGHITNGVFDIIDDTHIVSTNALTQYTASQTYGQTETVLLVQQPLPPLNTESSDLADIKALLQSLSERVTQLESAT